MREGLKLSEEDQKERLAALEGGFGDVSMFDRKCIEVGIDPYEADMTDLFEATYGVAIREKLKKQIGQYWVYEMFGQEVPRLVKEETKERLRRERGEQD